MTGLSLTPPLVVFPAPNDGLHVPPGVVLGRRFEVIRSEVFQPAISDKLASEWRRMLHWKRKLNHEILQLFYRFRRCGIAIRRDFRLNGDHRFERGEGAKVPVYLLSVHAQCSNIVLMGRVNGRSLRGFIETAVSRWFAGSVSSVCTVVIPDQLWRKET